jgi:hypothetical protein
VRIVIGDIKMYILRVSLLLGYVWFATKIKSYFGILENLYFEQKVVTWFSEEQNFQFLSSSLPPNFSGSKNNFKIKQHNTTRGVLFSSIFILFCLHQYNTVLHFSLSFSSMNVIFTNNYPNVIRTTLIISLSMWDHNSSD